MSHTANVAPATQEDASSSALVYLDYNCFQRGFDDPAQVRIRVEK
jgi:hypothetical protein